MDFPWLILTNQHAVYTFVLSARVQKSVNSVLTWSERLQVCGIYCVATIVQTLLAFIIIMRALIMEIVVSTGVIQRLWWDCI